MNWKSFRHAVLPIDPLTVLIGTNASGKTNAVEGLDFLRWAALPNELDSGFRAQSGDIRGEIRSAARKPETCFTLEALVQGKYSENTDYLYSITVNTASDNPLHSEKLTQIRYHPQTKAAPERIDLYKTDEPKADSQFISVTIYDKRGGVKQKYRRRMSILTQMGLSAIEEYEALRNRPSSLPEGSLKYEEEELYQVEAEELIVPTTEISEALQNIFILRPNPDSMRRYSRLARYLASNASNIAGVLAELPEPRKKEVEDTLSKYLGQLPEGDLRRVWAEPVGRLNKDAMLYCEE
ncbi:ATP-binding protein, partial [Candidatus Poribacteria bacterium]|nr:ATP-binding protein [Candidatus Poribacteria bacterium]